MLGFHPGPLVRSPLTECLLFAARVCVFSYPERWCVGSVRSWPWHQNSVQRDFCDAFQRAVAILRAETKGSQQEERHTQLMGMEACRPRAHGRMRGAGSGLDIIGDIAACAAPVLVLLFTMIYPTSVISPMQPASPV